MFVELTDILRCPADHEDSWLVLAASSTADRHVLEGWLGCPVCNAEYPLKNGVADFRGAAQGGEAPNGERSRQRADSNVSEAALTAESSSAPGAAQPGSRETLTIAMAAYAGLTEPGGVVAVGGRLCELGGNLEQLAGVRVLAVNPQPGLSGRQSTLLCAGKLPLAASSIRALLLDSESAETLELASAIQAVRSGGRIVLPAHVPLPAGVTELASDDEWRVAERRGQVVELRARGSGSG